jgi:hypothetical protein
MINIDEEKDKLTQKLSEQYSQNILNMEEYEPDYFPFDFAVKIFFYNSIIFFNPCVAILSIKDKK